MRLVVVKMGLSIYQFWLIQYYSIKDNGDHNQLFDQVNETVEWIWLKICVVGNISNLTFESQLQGAKLWDVKDLYLVWLERFMDIHKSINETYTKHAQMCCLSLIVLKILFQFFVYIV